MLAAECSPRPKLAQHQHFVPWEFEHLEQAFGSSSPQPRPLQHRFPSPASSARRAGAKSPLGRGKRHAEEALPPTLWTVKMLVELAWELWNNSPPQSQPQSSPKRRQD